jgi:hypothetical protein
VEDALTIGKIRFFIGEYQRGNGATATAYHFLDADDARPLMADLGWSKPVDFVDYKGSANGGQPVSRVLKVRGPKDGKYWLEIQNGPGEIIGAGAVKPAGDPDASISIALSLWEARKLALAIQEYMTAYRVATFGDSPGQDPGGDRPQSVQSAPSPSQGEARGGGPSSDLDDLFGPDPAPSGTSSPPASPQKPEVPVVATTIVDQDTGRVRQVKATHRDANPGEGGPPAFYTLANEAIKLGLLETVQALVKAPGSWREKTAKLQQAMAA